MGYATSDAIARAHAMLGHPDATDWERFVDYLGLVVCREDLPRSVPAMIVGDTIVIARWLRDTTAAESVWHEIGHWWLHDGEVEWWLSRPQGYLTVSRFERQARDFARLFPDWGSE